MSSEEQKALWELWLAMRSARNAHTVNCNCEYCQCATQLQKMIRNDSYTYAAAIAKATGKGAA